jgi:hypothetical protein
MARVNKNYDFHWNGNDFVREVREAMADRLEDAARELKETVQMNIGVVADEPSRAGEYPHSVSGDLQRGIEVVAYRAKLQMDVTSTDPKSSWLEEGTRYMAPRPFMHKSMVEYKPRLRQLLMKPRLPVGRYA